MAADPHRGDLGPVGGRGLKSADDRAASSLAELARLHGVQGSYVDLLGRRRRASRDATLAALRALGAPVDRASDVPAAIRERREQVWSRILEPVAVVWEGLTPTFDLRLPPGPARVAELRLELEGGGAVREWRERIADLVPLPSEPGDSGFGTRRRLVLSDPLPLGYHRLRAEAAGRAASCLVISAPQRSEPGLAPGSWGVFLPLYALWSRRSWGVGDLTDLAALRDRIGSFGGRVVGTMPLFAAFLRDPVEPSPYSPVSRLFWNELYVDVERAPEMARSSRARRLADAPATRRALSRLRREPLVPLEEIAGLKRSVLAILAEALHRSGSRRRSALEDFAREHPELDDYARFRAAGERWRVDWRVWPGPARDGRLRASDVDPDAWRYHRYAQFLADEQMAELRRGVEGGGGLYLDMPLGVHPDGYDVWRRREAFVHGVSAGAPPDDFFTGGQDWGFPPPHPDRIREDGYGYQIACLRRAMRHAAALRIDHVMGLHRLFWVPHGFPADRGLYVRYHPEEWYAIATLESRRAGTTIVGEDLGTVPPAVRAAMRRHGLLRSYVLQMEVGAGRRLRPPHPRSMAALNTHDMSPFAGWWRDLDPGRRAHLIEDLRRAALLPPDGEPSEAAVVRACLVFLASSGARLVVANLEDLWGERSPQNVPGVVDPSNWRRRAAHPVEALPRLQGLADTLAEVGALRRQTAAVSRRRAGGERS